MLYFTDLPAIKFSVAAEKLTHRLVPLPALSDAPGHAPNPPSCRPRPCQGFRQRQGGDAEGGGPIPSGAESVRPRAPTAPAGLGEERGFWSLSRPTRGRSTRPRPYGEVPIPFSLLHLQPVYAGNRNIRQVPGEAEMQRDFFETRTKVLSGQKTFSNKTVTTRREILPGSSESGGQRLDGPPRRF